MKKIMIVCLLALLAFSSCYRKPDLHLYWPEIEMQFPVVDLDLETYWDYEMNLGIDYDWRAEWYYGWDDEDRRLFGELGYTEPSKFHLRRYYTGHVAGGHRLKRLEVFIEGKHYRDSYDWGFWDILAWNNVETLDGIQSLRIDESNNYDEDITASTGQTMNNSRYHAPRYQNSFYEPEQLFSALESAIDINEDLRGFVYNEEENLWIRNLRLLLEPITYIYLPQVILHHNNGRISQIHEGRNLLAPANLSGLARSTSLNTGVTGKDAIAVSFNMRQKFDMDFKDGEKVDIIGGRMMTFGICGQNANRVSRADEVNEIDPQHHYLDVTLHFSQVDMDSTLVFDVTDQVRQRYKGGVITVELDMDTVPNPNHDHGSGFDAVVKDFEEVNIPIIDL